MLRHVPFQRSRKRPTPGTTMVRITVCVRVARLMLGSGGTPCPDGREMHLGFRRVQGPPYNPETQKTLEP